MVIKVADLTDEILAIEETGLFDDLFTDEYDRWKLKNISLTVYKVNKWVFIKGKVILEIQLECSRCIEDYPVDTDININLRYYPSGASEAEEIEISRNEMNIDFYSNGVIDINNLILEQALLSIPMKPLCSDGCKGLCPVCGCNRNIKPCNCHVDTNS